MATIKAQFGALNTEADPNVLPSGTADISLNVVRNGSQIEGRAGFDIFYTPDVEGPAESILNLFVAKFADGTIYLVAKRTDGFLYQVQRYPTDAGVWTKIINKQSETGRHSLSDRGWFFMWANRVYYFDSVGGTKWWPTGTYKAGLGMPPRPGIARASGGGKEGIYHVYAAMKNALTNEIGQVSPPAAATDTFLSATGEEPPQIGGALYITNWSTVKASTDYEYDSIIFYCTKGDTEYVALGTGMPVYSQVAYEDTISPVTGSTPGLATPDHVLASRMPFTNAGGEPPASKIGCCNGSRAVYLGLATAGRCEYSLPRWPLAVPRQVTYAGGTNLSTFYPRPWEGVLLSGFDGPAMAVGSVGESFIVFTGNSTWRLSPTPEGRLHPTVVNRTIGCLSGGGAVTALSGVHALGNAAWTLTHQQEQVNLAYQNFTPTLVAIPVANRQYTVGGYYSYKRQIWMAVKTATGTDILIWDEALRGLASIFRPANLTTVRVTAMVEYSTPAQGPIMLLALSDGKILSWPGAAYNDNGTGYACQWRGYFGQERRDRTEYLIRLDTHMRANASGITIGMTPMMTANEANASEVTKTVAAAALVDQSAVEYARTQGSMYRVSITSVSGAAGWSIAEMVFHTEIKQSA